MKRFARTPQLFMFGSVMLCSVMLVYDHLVDSVITSQIEHHAVLNACAAVSRRGIYVHYLSVEHGGTVLPETLALGMTEKKSLVSIMMVNNEIGTIEPIQELAAGGSRGRAPSGCGCHRPSPG